MYKTFLAHWLELHSVDLCSRMCFMWLRDLVCLCEVLCLIVKRQCVLCFYYLLIEGGNPPYPPYFFFIYYCEGKTFIIYYLRGETPLTPLYFIIYYF